MIRNFLFEVCGCTGSWTMANYAKTAIASIKETVGDGKSYWPFPAVSTALSQQPHLESRRQSADLHLRRPWPPS